MIEKGPPTIGLSFPKMTTLTLRAPVQIKEPQPSTGMTAPTTALSSSNVNKRANKWG